MLLVNLYLDNGMDINQIKDVVSIVSGDFDRIYAYSNLIVNFLRKRKRTIDSEINLSSALKEVGGFYQTIVKSFDITLNFVCEDTIEYKIKQIDFADQFGDYDYELQKSEITSRYKDVAEKIKRA